jgi:hypothetical protein
MIALKDTLTILQLIVTSGTFIGMIYALYKFTRRPQDALSDRVTTLEVKVGEVEDSLKMGNDKFRSQHEVNEVLLRSLLALIEFEIQYCITEKKPISDDLKKAKDDLHTFLSKR